MRGFSVMILFCLCATALGQSTWTGAASGNWSDTGNWTGGVPDNVNALATLPATVSNTFINVNESVFLGTLNIASNAYLYYLTGTSPLMMATSSGQAQINNTAGNNILLAPLTLGNDTTLNIATNSSLSISDTFNARGTNVTKTGGGLVAVPYVQASTLTINQGTVQVLSNGTASGVSLVHGFTLASGASLDLENNSFIDNYGSGADPISTITSEVATAYDDGKWDKPGITSSMASFANGTTLAAADASTLGITTFENQSVNNSVIVKYTWFGDANMDGVVNAADVTFMQKNAAAGGTGWTAGDFNYDGKINADDFALFMLGEARQTGQLGTGTTAPEPTLFLAPIAAIFFLRPRRTGVRI